MDIWSCNSLHVEVPGHFYMHPTMYDPHFSHFPSPLSVLRPHAVEHRSGLERHRGEVWIWCETHRSPGTDRGAKAPLMLLSTLEYIRLLVRTSRHHPSSPSKLCPLVHTHTSPLTPLTPLCRSSSRTPTPPGKANTRQWPTSGSRGAGGCVGSAPPPPRSASLLP